MYVGRVLLDVHGDVGHVDDDDDCRLQLTDDTDADGQHRSLFVGRESASDELANESCDGPRGGLFAAFSHGDDDDDDAANVTSDNAFSFLAGFDTSVADVSATSDGPAFQFSFGDDANCTSDDDNAFTLF